MNLHLDDYTISVRGIEIFLSDWQKKHDYSKLIVLCDDHTSRLCLPVLKEKCPDLQIDHIIEVPHGEKNKTIETCEYIWGEILRVKADRNACLINLGGGVIGDMGGFCAATYKRGIDFLQIPTTLLSMVDSSIGGKLGVDFASLKNVIGAFKNPSAVLIDTDFLKTLDERQIMSGFAETIKHALIGDKNLWQILYDSDNLLDIVDASIVPSLEVKRRIVDIDPFEKKDRKALNFGHTIGHALESYFLSHEVDILHGEAVVLGMIAEIALSVKVGLAEETRDLITSFLLNNYVLNGFSEWDENEVLEHAKNDKKNKNDVVLCTLIPEIGSYTVDESINKEDIIFGLNYLRESLLHNRK